MDQQALVEEPTITLVTPEETVGSAGCDPDCGPSCSPCSPDIACSPCGPDAP